MTRLIIEGWLLGLSTGTYCLGACAPFMIPYLFAEGRPTWRDNLSIIGEFLLGRFFAYLLFGALVGWVGALLRPHISQQLAQAAVSFTAALMILYALVQNVPHWTVCAWMLRRLSTIHLPLVMGFLIGINVCPPFLVAMARLLQVGGPSNGILFFIGFFVGTSLYTIPLLSLSPLTHQARFQRIGRLSALLVGSWLLINSFLGS